MVRHTAWNLRPIECADELQISFDDGDLRAVDEIRRSKPRARATGIIKSWTGRISSPGRRACATADRASAGPPSGSAAAVPFGATTNSGP